MKNTAGHPFSSTFFFKKTYFCDVKNLDRIRLALRERILLLDGAMGTMLQRHGKSGNFDALNRTEPELVAAVHGAYIEAGADIIETNTFSSNRISQKEYGLEDQAATLAREGARIARREADKALRGGRQVWVAGSVGPTSKSLTLGADLAEEAAQALTFDQMAEVYREQMAALIDGGADLILIETCFDALNAKAALYALSQVSPGFPAIVSVSPGDRAGRTLTGQTVEAFLTAVRHYPLLAFGLNCSLGAEGLMPLVETLAHISDLPVVCYPNAGLPNAMGQYEELPGQMADTIRKAAQAGCVNIVGGCCGTTPDHIAALATALKDIPPRPVPEPDGLLRVSGLENVTIDVRHNNLTTIGERTNVAGSRKFARLIASGDYASALQVAANQIEGGDSLTGEKRFTPDPDGYAHADGLVAAIRTFERESDRRFCIGVGGYPEKHFEAANLETDIEHLKQKVDAGADYIITQMFFDNAVFYRFVELCRAAGITVPILPGLKPLSTARQVALLPESFSIDIPRPLTEAVRKAGDDKEAVYRIGTDWCIAQCRDLLAHGVPAVHFYTMGRSRNIAEILRTCF